LCIISNINSIFLSVKSFSVSNTPKLSKSAEKYAKIKSKQVRKAPKTNKIPEKYANHKSKQVRKAPKSNKIPEKYANHKSKQVKKAPETSKSAEKYAKIKSKQVRKAPETSKSVEKYANHKSEQVRKAPKTSKSAEKYAKIKSKQVRKAPKSNKIPEKYANLWKKKGNYMNIMKKKLEEREKMLKQLIKKNSLAINKAPDGTLKAKKHGKGFQYFQYISGEKSEEIYLKKNQFDLAKSLAQKEYDSKVLNCAQRELKLLTKLNNLYQQTSVESIYDEIATSKQSLINPIYLPDKQYIQQWQKMEYHKLEYYKDEMEFCSDRGEKMRSKSEVLIANALNKRNIPYIYERPLELNFYGVVYPDFTILKVDERKEIYWEHFGLMDHYDYREKNLQKIMYYEMNNFILGENMIVTFETAKHPLLSRTIDMFIDKFLV